jgi:hypothetical protein
MRQVMHAFQQALHARLRLAHDLLRRCRRGVSDSLQVDRERHGLLADVVVQFERNARALFFLCLEQPPAQIAQTILESDLRKRVAVGIALRLSALVGPYRHHSNQHDGKWDRP